MAMMGITKRQTVRCVLALVLCDVSLYTCSISAHLRKPAPSAWQPDRQHYVSQRLYIAAYLHNAERVLPAWSNSLIRTVDLNGPENCFVSILTGGSTDATSQLLRELEATLRYRANASFSIVTNGETPQGALSSDVLRERSIYPYSSVTQQPLSSRRMPYLARQRDSLLLPFREMAARGKHYDKIVILDDVYFEVRGQLQPCCRPNARTA
jgi:hypothetical protein